MYLLSSLSYYMSLPPVPGYSPEGSSGLLKTRLHGWPQKQHGSPPWNDCREAQTAVHPEPQ